MSRAHGRLYVNSIPLGWSKEDVKNWAQGAGVNGIGAIHLLRAGVDMRSVYIHVHAPQQQLDQCPSLLSGWYLTHRPTMCELSMGHDDKTPAAWYKRCCACGKCFSRLRITHVTGRITTHTSCIGLLFSHVVHLVYIGLCVQLGV